MPGFSRSVAAFGNKVKGLQLQIFRESCKRMIRQAQLPVDAGGNMRVKTGYLRASIKVSLTSRPSVRSNSYPVEGHSYSYNEAVVMSEVNRAKSGDTVFVGWTASYAGIREFHDAFARLAAQSWRSIVDQVARELGDK